MCIRAPLPATEVTAVNLCKSRHFHTSRIYMVQPNDLLSRNFGVTNEAKCFSDVEVPIHALPLVSTNASLHFM